MESVPEITDFKSASSGCVRFGVPRQAWYACMSCVEMSRTAYQQNIADRGDPAVGCVAGNTFVQGIQNEGFVLMLPGLRVS